MTPGDLGHICVIVVHDILQSMKLNHVSRSVSCSHHFHHYTVYELLPVSSMESHITIKMQTLTQLVLIAVMQHMLFLPFIADTQRLSTAD